MTINKKITTNVTEQIKSGLIVALLVGIAAFAAGVHYQKSSTVAVNNQVIVQQK